jgi:hypothetical protein
MKKKFNEGADVISQKNIDKILSNRSEIKELKLVSTLDPVCNGKIKLMPSSVASNNHS